MTVEELYELLGDMIAEDDRIAAAPVKIATQPNWPMEQAAGQPVFVQYDGDDELDVRTLYIPVDDAVSNDYLAGAAQEELGW